jgi:uncharacterized protein YbjQ (UPF0145 family)
MEQTERGGFEPPNDETAVNGFRDRRFQPLSHLSRAPRSIERAASRGSACRERDYGQAMDEILIVTTNEVPGYQITQVHGEVCGLIVRARNAFSNMGAGLRTVFGGEARGYTTLLLDSRNEALERLREATREKGGNAVVAMRFDCNEIASIMSEVAAYGTAVTISRS